MKTSSTLLSFGANTGRTYTAMVTAILNSALHHQARARTAADMLAFERDASFIGRRAVLVVLGQPKVHSLIMTAMRQRWQLQIFAGPWQELQSCLPSNVSLRTGPRGEHPTWAIVMTSPNSEAVSHRIVLSDGWFAGVICNGQAQYFPTQRHIDDFIRGLQLAVLTVEHWPNPPPLPVYPPPATESASTMPAAAGHITQGPH